MTSPPTTTPPTRARLPTAAEMDEMSGRAFLEAIKELNEEEREKRKKGKSTMTTTATTARLPTVRELIADEEKLREILRARSRRSRTALEQAAGVWTDDLEAVVHWTWIEHWEAERERQKTMERAWDAACHRTVGQPLILSGSPALGYFSGSGLKWECRTS